LQQTYDGMLASVLCLDNGLERFQDTCQCFDKVVIRGRYIRLWRPAIVSARGAEDDLQRSVRERRFPICPHSVRPAEVRKVVEYVTKQGGRLSVPFRRNFRGWERLSCDICGITTNFETSRLPNGRPMLRESVERRMRRFENVTDPAWAAQVALREVVAKLDDEWQACVKSRLDAAKGTSSRASFT